MSDIELLILSVALGTDLFSMAIPIGMKPVRLKIIFWAAITFAAFHIVLILAGYYMGHFMGGIVEKMSTYPNDCKILAVENWASILGALVLTSLGIYMIKENLAASPLKTDRAHPLQGISLFLLATSVSLDALAAGFSMGMMDVNLMRLSLILGTIIFSIAVVGLRLGKQVGQYVGKRAELIGGMVLILLGLHVVWNLW